MNKYKIGHFEAFKVALFTQKLPSGETGGETLANEQPTIDEIWKWFGDPDAY